LGVSFLTGAYVGDNLELRLSRTTRRYATGWLFFDLCLVVNDWVSYGLCGEGPPASPRCFTMHLLRLLRLLRLPMLLHGLAERINSNAALLALSMLRLVLCASATNHLVACAWYGISHAANGSPTNAEADGNLAARYAWSLRWAPFANIHAEELEDLQSLQEYIFAIAAALFAPAALVALLGAATFVAIQFLQIDPRRSLRQECLLRCYLRDRAISPELSARIKTYLQGAAAKSKTLELEVPALRALPHDFRAAVHEEARGPLICGHRFFAGLRASHSSVLRQLCHTALQEEPISPGLSLFLSGQPGHRMRFVASGSLRYAPRSPSSCTALESQRVVDGQWLSEAALWTLWQHRGNLFAASDGLILALLVDCFASVVRQHEVVHNDAAKYAAKFIEAMNSAAACSDLFTFDTELSPEGPTGEARAPPPVTRAGAKRENIRSL